MKRTFLIALGLLLAALALGGLVHSTQPGGGAFDLIAFGLLGYGSWAALKAARGPAAPAAVDERPWPKPPVR